MRLSAVQISLDGDTIGLGAPRVGLFTAEVLGGQFVEGGQRIGCIEVLRATYDVLVPVGVAGRLGELRVRSRHAAVGYGDVLAVVQATGASVGGEDDEIDAGGIVFAAPMDGQLYLRPSPEDAPFVEEGSVVEPGATLALVEVMKFFYPLRWEGDGPATVIRIPAEDAAPVEAGAPLFVLRT